MLSAVQCFLLGMAGYVLIYGGLAFTNGKFFPQAMAGVYEHTNFWVRLALFSAVICFAANFMFAKMFQISSASVAGPMIIVAVVLTSVGNAIVMDGARLTAPVIGATILALFSCALVSWLLMQAR